MASQEDVHAFLGNQALRGGSHPADLKESPGRIDPVRDFLAKPEIRDQ